MMRHLGGTALVALLLLSGCAYSRAVDAALWPLLQESFAEIEVDVQWYLDTAPLDEVDTRATLSAFSAALTERDARVVLALWPRIEAAALAGVEAMEAAGRGSVTASIRREEIRRYSMSVGRLIQ